MTDIERLHQAKDLVTEAKVDYDIKSKKFWDLQLQSPQNHGAIKLALEELRKAHNKLVIAQSSLRDYVIINNTHKTTQVKL